MIENKKIRSCFETLVAASSDNIAREVRPVVEAFYQEAGYQEGEINECFNQILVSSTGTPEMFSGNSNEAHRLRCVAEVLLGIADQSVETNRKPVLHRHGWSALNRDAKGWCRWLLRCEASRDLSEESLRELVLAKSLVGKLVTGDNEDKNESALPVNVDRDPVKEVKPSDMLEKGIDS